jgi:hypothetical protein
LNSEFFGVRRRGRPRKRWLQDVKDVLRWMTGKWKEKYMAANCEWSQSPPRAVELRKKMITIMKLKIWQADLVATAFVVACRRVQP